MMPRHCYVQDRLILRIVTVHILISCCRLTNWYWTRCVKKSVDMRLMYCLWRQYFKLYTQNSSPFRTLHSRYVNTVMSMHRSIFHRNQVKSRHTQWWWFLLFGCLPFLFFSFLCRKLTLSTTGTTWQFSSCLRVSSRTLQSHRSYPSEDRGKKDKSVENGSVVASSFKPRIFHDSPHCFFSAV